MSHTVFRGGDIVLADRLLSNGCVTIQDDRITGVSASAPASGDTTIDLKGGYLSPGFVELHVHGGDGADFMDVTPDAFRTICRAHARHGTTALLPTTTVASHEQHLTFLGLCQRMKDDAADGARIL